MRLRLIVLLAVALGCVALCCQAATNDVASQISANTVNNTSASATTLTLSTADSFGNSDDLLLNRDRLSLSKLFSSPRENNITSARCTNNCSDGQLQCGTACCNSNEQCCLNTSNGTHYCSTQCN